ncbi:MAG: hypothetical protein QM809_17225 [Gordonia sp. (in: high G+C Gram-positive bacteria)]|uniref:hypothetical protein n=1 Tax=Gordonia sp. (in: high G+C Gram-positive bacteria) TaxID=84139 RepID=UPI0039E3B824
MSDTSGPASMFHRFIHGCFWFLGAVIALTLAVDLLRLIWPWLVGGLVLTVVAVGAWRLWQFQQQNRY